MTYTPLPPNNRVILISGANRGIGFAIAERLYQEGYKLSLGARRPESLAPLISKMEKGRVSTHQYDAAKVETATAWVESAVKKFGRIDGVVNNAGIYLDFTVESEEVTAMDEMWLINTKGPLRLMRGLSPI